MAQNVSFLIKIDDGGSFRKVEVDADSLRDAVAGVKDEAERLNSSVVNLAQTAVSIQAMQESLGGISQVVSALTDTYAAQEVAEAKLANNMRNTMGAREEEVASIRTLISAQEDLGVVSGAVQTAGAQELATYLGQKESLEQLIPVMNDMLAQQYGLEASQESAAQIASMLGKVMDGQVGALSRYGYTFDEAQEHVLKFGTESERAAVLAEVVSSSVGGMNEALARTDAGRQQQLANAIDNVKASLGSMLQRIQPLLSIVGTALTAAANVGILANSVNVLRQSVDMAAIRTALLEVRTKALTTAQTLFNNVAKANPYVLLATAIIGVTTAVVALTGHNDRLSESERQQQKQTADLRREHEELARTLQEAEQSAYTETASSLRIYTEKLGTLLEKKKSGEDTHRQEKKLIGELNTKYGEAFGTYASVVQWYETLTANSEAYCRQMVLEARTRALANQIAAKEQEKHDIIYDGSGKARMYSKENRKEKQYGWVNGMSIAQLVELPGTSDHAEAQKKVRAIDADIKSLTSQMHAAAKESDALFASIKRGDGGGGGGLNANGNTNAGMNANVGNNVGNKVDTEGQKAHIQLTIEEIETYRQLEDEIRYTRELLLDANAQERPAIRQNLRELELIKEAWDKEGQAAEKATETVGEALMEQERSLEKTKLSLRDAWGSLKNIGGGIEGITDAIEGNGNAWERIAAIVDGAISVYDGITTVVGFIRQLTGVSLGHAAAKVVEATAEGAETAQLVAGGVAANATSAATIAVLGAETAAWTALAAAKTYAAHAYIPFAGFGIATGYVTAMQGIIAAAAIPKFADGGLAYGPTLGIFGEYANARSNPEVVAPLNKLRDIIGGGAGMNGKVDFRIKGRYLRGILQKENQRMMRS